jgi:transposase-like protein
VFLDATYIKARVDSRVMSRAVVIATGVTADGGREVLGCEVGDSEDGAFWTAFLRSLKARGLTGVQLVVSDAHTGPAEVADQIDKVAATLQPRFPQVAALLTEAKEDLTAFRHFPVAHWRKRWSTNPLERLNKELKRRTHHADRAPLRPQQLHGTGPRRNPRGRRRGRPPQDPDARRPARRAPGRAGRHHGMRRERPPGDAAAAGRRTMG